MKPLYNHSLLTSFYLFLDNQLCNGAQAYINFSTGLYPMGQGSNGYIYATPWKQLIYDSCVSGATIPSGVYNSAGQFLTRTSGIVFDFNQGRIFSPTNLGNGVSGSFARKEYNLYMSTEEETRFWLDNVYKSNKDITYTPTGTPAGLFTAPCIILTNAREQNDPFGLGGLDMTHNTIRAYIISNNNYLQEGVDSYFRDLSRNYAPLAPITAAPLNGSGDLKSATYCYTDFCSQYGINNGIFIETVHNVKLGQQANETNAFTVSISEFDVEVMRQPSVNK